MIKKEPVIETYKFKRGDDYSVDVAVTDDQITAYFNFKMPDKVEASVFSKFIEDAEHAVIKKLEMISHD